MQNTTTLATQIAPEKIRAYMATDYRLGHTSDSPILNIDVRSEALAELFAQHGVQCGGFITAYNPQGQQQSEHINNAAHQALRAMLQAAGHTLIEGSGSEEGTDWPSEKSFFAFGLEEEPAKAIGRHFNQDAIVWVGSNAVPKLVLLR